MVAQTLTSGSTNKGHVHMAKKPLAFEMLLNLLNVAAKNAGDYSPDEMRRLREVIIPVARACGIRVTASFTAIDLTEGGVASALYGLGITDSKVRWPYGIDREDGPFGPPIPHRDDVTVYSLPLGGDEEMEPPSWLDNYWGVTADPDSGLQGGWPVLESPSE